MTSLRFEADLDLVVTPVDGGPPITARVHGEEATLVVRTEEPSRLVSALRAAGATDVRGLGRGASFLAARDVALQVEGPGGTVLRIGSGAASPLGRLLTGSSAVGIGSPRAVAPIARGAVTDLVGTRPGWLGLAAVAAALALVALLRRRRR